MILINISGRAATLEGQAKVRKGWVAAPRRVGAFLSCYSTPEAILWPAQNRAIVV
jgi:hypothetical protein